MRFLNWITDIRTEKTLADHALVMIASGSALFAIGMSLNKPILAWTLTILVIVAGSMGYGLSRLVSGTFLQNWDAGIWTFFGLFSVLFTLPLNQILPEEGFPLGLMAGSFLSWMIILGSVAAWKDRTLLFVSLPCIAIFGLVGTFDTYPTGIWLFFVFLICMGVLYARVHQRTMVQTAKLAGEEDPSLLRRGAWKWMAGPEWAVASGISIVVLSLIGAPVVRNSVQGVSEGIRVRVAQPPSTNNNRNQGRSQNMGTESRIGQGPNNPSDTPVFKLGGDNAGLYRVQPFISYTGLGWSNQSVSRVPSNSPLLSQVSLSDDLEVGPNGGKKPWLNGTPPGEPLADPEILAVQVLPLRGISTALPSPGPIVELIPPKLDVMFLANGSTLISAPPSPGTTYRYWAAVPKSRPDDRGRATIFPDLENQYLSTGASSREIRSLAFEITKGLTSDMEKAQALERWVGRRAKYNLNAAATPRDKDPVQHFLFDSREGYCDLFASSFVLLAREAGLPTRYMTGWLTSDLMPDEQGWMTVRERDYHAWAEVYFEGYGWVSFDPTQLAEQVPGGEVGSTRKNNQPFWLNPFFFPVLLTLVLGTATFPIIRSILAKIRNYFDPAVRRKAQLLATFANFHLAIEKALGHPKRFSQTVREYTVANSDALGPNYEPAMKIVQQLEGAMFSPRSLDPAGVDLLQKEVQAFQKDLAEWVKMSKRSGAAKR